MQSRNNYFSSTKQVCFEHQNICTLCTLLRYLIKIRLSTRTAIDTTSLSFKNVGTKSLHGNLLEGVAVRASRAIHGGKPTIITDFVSTHIFHFHNVFYHSFTLNALLKVIQGSQGAPW